MEFALTPGPTAFTYSSVTMTGVVRLVIVPSPSWPTLFSPQQARVPSARNAHPFRAPAPMDVTVVRSVTATGI